MPLPKYVPEQNNSSSQPQRNVNPGSSSVSKIAQDNDDVDFLMENSEIPNFFDDDEEELVKKPVPKGRENASAPVQKPFSNEYDPEDDDTFSEISIDDQIDEYEEEEDEDEILRREMKRKAAEKKIQISNDKRKKDIDDARTERIRQRILEEQEQEQEEEDDDDDSASNPVALTPEENIEKTEEYLSETEFVDKKKLKLKPFGDGSKKKRKPIKEHEFDNRKNLRQNARIVQLTALGLTLAILGLGVKNTFFQPDQLTEDEISTLSRQSVGMTNFPLTRGEGFATNFMAAYLNANSDDVSGKILNYYYNGTMSDDTSAVSDSTISENRIVSSNFKQTVVFGPTVYDTVAISDYSARYTIGAVVKDQQLDDNGNPITVDPADPNAVAPATKTRWEFFNVNVYYDETTDSFTILPDSPTVIPSSEVGEVSNLPEEMPLGTGESDQDLGESLQPVIYGFLDGYAKSSSSDHSTMDQYIITNPPVDLTKGLNNEYTFAGDQNDSITYEAYPTDDPNVVKVLTTVKWRNSLTESEDSGKIEYSSTYVMTLEKQSNGKYLVSKFQPKYFVKDDTDTEG